MNDDDKITKEHVKKAVSTIMPDIRAVGQSLVVLLLVVVLMGGTLYAVKFGMEQGHEQERLRNAAEKEIDMQLAFNAAGTSKDLDDARVEACTKAEHMRAVFGGEIGRAHV